MSAIILATNVRQPRSKHSTFPRTFFPLLHFYARLS
jgi:hypothetical protein